MNNKVLVLVYVPLLDVEYECFIPIGKTVGTIKKIIVDAISKINEVEFLKQVKIIDKDNSTLYSDEILIKEANIKNGTKLLLI